MRLRSLTIAATACIAAGGLIPVAPANAAPATLYAYPFGTGSPTGCPASATPADQCSLDTALARAEPGDTVELADGAHPYVGNWAVGNVGTPTTAAPITIEGAPDISLVPVLDGNHGSTTGCSTARCSDSILRIAGGASVIVQRLRFTDADSSGTEDGGAIDIGNAALGGTLTVRDVTFDHNVAARGGAINAGYYGSATVAVSGSTFTDNAAITGGAISSSYFGHGGALSVDSSSFRANGAHGDGGAIDSNDVGDGGTLSVHASTFSGNHGFSGGAIQESDEATAGSATIRASTFTLNSAQLGGAIDVGVDGGNDTTTVLGATFVGDTTVQLNGTPVSGPEIAASIGTGHIAIAGSLFGGTCSRSSGTVWIDDGHNAGVDGSCLNKGSGDVMSTSVGGRLAALATNRSSATQTIALTTGNPAIGLVPSGATAPHAPAAYRALCPRTDQTGYRTPTGSACDAGAVDLAAPLKPTITISGSLAVARGSKHTITGRTRPGATVTLYGGSTRLATTTATRTGAFAFTRTITATTRFSANADHQSSATLTLTVVILTLTPASRPLTKGAHTLTGHAPAGRSVSLLRDGHTVARTTATAKNGYAFKVLIDATHRFQVSCDGITTRPITIRVSS